MPLDTPLPLGIALVDDDPEFSRYLIDRLAHDGVTARQFADSESLLASDGAFEHDFYVLDIGLPGVDGLALLNVLRRRSRAGVLVVSGMMGADRFEKSLQAGADMYLAKPVTVDQVVMAIRAVQRRTGQPLPTTAGVPLPASASAGDLPTTPPKLVWRLVVQASILIAPDGQRIDLSAGDLAALRLLAEAEEHAVTREALCAVMGLPQTDEGNLLTAAMYRLRRRIERHTAGVAPLQSRNRFGYQFKGQLQLG